MNKKTGLGRGIGALLEGVDTKDESSKYFMCPMEKLRPNADQPRKSFDRRKLEELIASVIQKGVIQPLIVRKLDDGNGCFEIVAGERRWRAAQEAGLKEVPVVVEEVDDQSSLEMALIENLQREDLNPIEEARAYSFLLERYDFSQDDVARKVGKQRSTVTNLLRLLKLPEDIQEDVVASRLSMGHARALLSLEDEGDIHEARNEVLARELSVRETEQLVKKIASKKYRAARHVSRLPQETFAEFSNHLKDLLKTEVAIKPRVHGGKIEIQYLSHEDLLRIVKLLSSDRSLT